MKGALFNNDDALRLCVFLRRVRESSLFFARLLEFFFPAYAHTYPHTHTHTHTQNAHTHTHAHARARCKDVTG